MNSEDQRRAKAYGLSEKQYSEIRMIFKQFDKDGNGKITSSELQNAIFTLGHHMSDREVLEMIRSVDTDGSGCIEFEEFLPLVARRFLKADRTPDAQEAFKAFDKDGDGFITFSELKEALVSANEDVNETQVRAMIDEADIDGDGKISFEEFVKYISTS